jgi:primosomal protein N' (replication factor Y)
MEFIQVLVPSILDYPLTYSNDLDSLEVGQIVEVELRKKKILGIVWEKNLTSSIQNIKPILKATSLFFDKNFLEFIEKFASYTLTPLGLVAKQILNFSYQDLEKIINQDIDEKLIALDNSQIELDNYQKIALEKITQKNEGFQTFFLDGVTGSGKTEVFLEAVLDCLKRKKQALILMPEIALTTNFVQRFTKHFGIKPLLWHSQTSEKDKRKIWKLIIEKKPIVVVGARSALFLPFHNLGLIVIDEEHDSSYKQEDKIIYNARDMSVLRAYLGNFNIVLVSATPSLETYVNTLSGSYHHLILPKKFFNSPVPKTEIVDKKDIGNKNITPLLIQHIKQNLSQKQQTLLFLNRRGYAPLVICKKCGHRFKCIRCSTWLVFHKSYNRMQCHYCSYNLPMAHTCPECQGEDCFFALGAGVEKIYEEVKDNFPNANVMIATSDLINTKSKSEKMIQDILENKVDIIIGTQILAKGHHFPDLTLVGVIDADLGLSGVDLRATEKNFQVLHQVSGRCGRQDKAGTVVIQTFFPQNLIVQSIANQNRDDFLKLEIEQRQISDMPPFSRLTAFIFTSRDEIFLKNFVINFAKKIPQHDQVMILGPIPAPLNFLNNQYRWRLLFKYPKNFSIQNWIKSWLKKESIDKNVKLTMDVDPKSFL